MSNRRARPTQLAHVVLLGFVLVAVGCAGDGSAPASDSRVAREWAIGIHGGAGVPRDSLSAAEQAAYRAALERALRLGAERLSGGAAALDVVEEVVRDLEDDPLFNAGRGAVFDQDGQHTLDASIMDGSTLACGAVAGVRTVRNPISLARHVMERTPHVLLAGEGAESFADEVGIERVEPSYFSTPQRREAFERSRAKRQASGGGGTVGAVARDRRGNLAAATSTGGLTGKRRGRVGDSPIPGAGTYANNTTCAVSGTGRGEEFIRNAVAHAVSERVRQGLDVGSAAREVVHGLLRPGDGGVIVVDRHGRLAFEFNTPGMFRGGADSVGRFDTAIWTEEPAGPTPLASAGGR